MLNLNKKILLISSWAPPKIGGAQNLYNIFSYINPSKYCILTSQQNFVGKNGKFGSSLECEYFFYDKKTKNIIIDPELPKNKTYHLIKKFPMVFNLIKNIIFFIKFITITLKTIIKVAQKGKKIIQKEKIDLIIGLSDVETNLLSSLLLSLMTKKDLIIYLFDLYLGNKLNFPYNLIAKLTESRIFKRAKYIIVTNEETKNYYVEKYGNESKYSVIYNSVSPDGYIKNIQEKQIDNKNNKIKIIFTGNIYWPQEQALKNLLKVIKNNKNILLDIYCPNIPKNILDEYGQINNIKFTNAQQSEMPKIQSEADILFLPFSWNTDAPDIIRTASPGKLTDYLIAGRPILIHAPNYSFVAKYAKENKFAEVVDENDINTLEKAIFKIANDKNYANFLIKNAKEVFYKNHNAIDNARKLVSAINNI